jgi:hypothetical protein
MRNPLEEIDMSADMEAKARNLKNILDGLVQEKGLTSEQADFIHQEAIARQFNDVLSSTDQLISYTGWMTTYSVGIGKFWFSSWSGNFIMQGPIYASIGSGLFPYARMEILTKYDYDGAKGTLLYLITPVYMGFDFYADADHKIEIGDGKAVGPAVAAGTGPGDFTIGKS